MIWDAQAHGVLVLQVARHFFARGQYNRVRAGKYLSEYAIGGRFEVSCVAAEHFHIRAEYAHRALAVPALDSENSLMGLFSAGQATQAEQCVRGIGDDAVFLQ